MIPIEDLTDVTLAFEDTDEDEDDGSCLLIKVVYWWKLFSDNKW